ncbi:MAG: CHASE2 domain-containing protein [Rhizonema sp. PD38]|nr:CHASE2 domain-containing protein [Rhizonema sp. PD38]
MAKLVVLKLDGDFVEQGFQVTLEIGEEGARPSTAITGLLPPAPELVAYYDHWQSDYNSLMVSTVRIKFEKIIYNGSVDKRFENCSDSTLVLSDRLNTWLNSESFHPIREQWLRQLMPSDEVRVLIHTRSTQLWQLPWHLWDLIDQNYFKAEVGLSLPRYEHSKYKTLTKRGFVRILAILGNSDGINVHKDRQLLEDLPNAAITFLVEPQRQDINEQLWKQPWDILFFAGHSFSEGETGRIYINKKDSLTISELKYAVRNAVAGGLQLAIFNSCDGLGLARELLDLQIPQIIVMREPVPDLVAHEFLKHFLKVFAQGDSLYLAVRKARERLQGLEYEFPCASWCPIICQNPAEIPPIWQQLCYGERKRQILIGKRFPTALLASVAITTLVMGIRYLGMLQTWELQAFDQLMRLRPDEAQDSRLLIVTVDEQDIQYQDQKGMERQGSLSNRALDLLLQKLEPYHPRAIGLNMYYDMPVKPEQQDKVTRLQKNQNFFAICKVSDPKTDNPGISPPPGIPIQRQGFSESVRDSDGILRRYLLAMIESASTTPCNPSYSLSALLAFHYLEVKGINPKYNSHGDLQIGKVMFKRLRSHMGGYQQVDARGYQILLNYRSYGRSPLEIAPTVTLTEVLKGEVELNDVKDRIVLIGITAPSADNYISTPYKDSQRFDQEIPGVIVQAQMVSQILSSVLDQRPLLSVLPFWGEALWIWSGSIVGGILGIRFRSQFHLILVGEGLLSILHVIICFGLFINGIWVPLIPSILAMVAAAGSVLIYTYYDDKKR